jgi:hypothetical protein
VRSSSQNLNLLHIIRQYDFNLDYARKLVEDLNETQMTTTPYVGYENHPAFTLGHLVTGSALMVEDLGGKLKIPEEWDELFLRKGPGDPRLPTTEINLYPSKIKLLEELEKQHETVKEALLSIDENKLNKEFKWRFSKYMPTLLDLAVFMCINHEAMHLGQLSAWRRAMGLPSALAGI